MANSGTPIVLLTPTVHAPLPGDSGFNLGFGGIKYQQNITIYWNGLVGGPTVEEQTIEAATISVNTLVSGSSQMFDVWSNGHGLVIPPGPVILEGTQTIESPYCPPGMTFATVYLNGAVEPENAPVGYLVSQTISTYSGERCEQGAMIGWNLDTPAYTLPLFGTASLEPLQVTVYAKFLATGFYLEGE